MPARMTNIHAVIKKSPGFPGLSYFHVVLGLAPAEAGEAVVHAQPHGVDAGADRARRWHAGEARERLGVEIDVQVFDLRAPVRGEGVFEAAACRPTVQIAAARAGEGRRRHEVVVRARAERVA